MRPVLFALLAIGLPAVLFSQPNYAIRKGRILTPWAEKLDPAAPLPEYPRPQMVRPNWTSLNGLWNYAIRSVSADKVPPAGFDGTILVPFAVESALSGVGKTVGRDQVLWYHRTVDISPAMRKGRLLLHFGAVDWRAELFVNGRPVGFHEGGYDPFSFDISGFLQKGNRQEIALRVWDPTDDGPQPRGKQVNKPEGIWYTPVTGIWQTVWLESVPATYIRSTRRVPDIDRSRLSLSVQLEAALPGDLVSVEVFDGPNSIATAETTADKASGSPMDIPIPDAVWWSPDRPHLYDLTILVKRKGKVIDQVRSYFAMRKISMAPDARGIQRMLLNNSFVFQLGPLDQGWWPDGLYTAPSDEALLFDIVKTKEMGFNMIRKHVKVEPARWYYHCDRLGMLVWQDMPSGDLGARWESRPGVEGLGREMDRSAESEAIYKKEWAAIMDALHPFPSIVVWVPFNEAWGQFKTEEIAGWTFRQDPSRLVNAASGGNFTTAGHITDLHNYPEPAMPAPGLFGSKHILVLGEFGGLGLPVPGHTWQEQNNWGYQSFKDGQQLLQRYRVFMERMPGLIKKGLSAAVYTQTTDVEVEVNGLMTYDRKLVKMPVDSLRQLHSTVIRTPSE